MQTLKDLRKWARVQCDLYPIITEEINDFVDLAQDEIDDGGSVSHEIQLAQNSIKELIKEEIGKIKNEEEE